jgi:hypothetical protein
MDSSGAGSAARDAGTRLSRPGEARRSSVPTGAELARTQRVIEAMNRAWERSQPGTLTAHEEGGWIYLSLTTGDVFTHDAKPGFGSTIDLSGATRYEKAILVGTYHTHPFPPAFGWTQGPSDADLSIGDDRGVPGIVRAQERNFVYGPSQREGGLDPCRHPSYPRFRFGSAPESTLQFSGAPGCPKP